MTVVFLGVYGFIACMIVLAIMVVREKKSITGAALEDAQTPDFLSVIGNYKRDSLAKHPWNMQYEVYKTIATVCSVVFAVLAFITSASLLYAFIAAAAGAAHVELTTLIVPGENDGEDEMRALSSWVASLDRSIPLHVTRFFPRRLMTGRPPTPKETLFRLAEIAREKLETVIVGNV